MCVCAKLAASSGWFVYICQPCQIQKYHRDKQFVLYMYSIKMDHNNIALRYIAS